MVLATLHGQPIESLDPSWTLVLSHSPTAEEDLDVVFDRPFPQYMKMEPDSCLGDAFDMRSAFRCFRTAGPLVSVRVDVDVGEPQRTIVVQYFKEEHANFARERGNALHRSLRQCKFTLQSFDPCNLHCSVCHACTLCRWTSALVLNFSVIYARGLGPILCSRISSIHFLK